MNCNHSHHHVNYNTRFAIGILLNLVFVLIELYYGKVSNSSALIADAFHNVGDIAGLLVSWLGVFLIRFKKNHHLTFALKNGTIVASFLNAILLIISVIYIFIESYKSLLQNQNIIAFDVIIVASIGIIINGITAFLFLSGARYDINIKSAFLHMVTDALVSLGVVISAIVVLYTGFDKIDSIVGMVIGLIILFSTLGLLKESTKLLFLGVPSHIKLEEVKKVILNHKGVISLHDLHIWGMSTTENALSVHLIVNTEYQNSNLVAELKKNFKIHHFTIQAEKEGNVCDDGC